MPHVGLSPISLTLSDDSAIESILSDIPFFCVGIMTFGVFTFVVVLKRVNLIAVYLYASSFTAFAAGIFDLGHVLVRGRGSSANGAGDDTASGLVTAREVSLALSLGFNFIFLWNLVAQCPRNEQGAPPVALNSNLDPMAYIHSASWKRWGLMGLFLKYSLLGLSFSIPILQIVWRISPPTVRFGTVYIAEATIEVVVSALFILKIFLNIFLSPLTPWWRPLQSNIAPLFALSISSGLGLGNLVALAFSETTLGRFLRAVEMYILIVSALITAFYEIPPPSSSPQDHPGKSFIRISEKPQAPVVRTIPPLVTSLGVLPRRRSAVPVSNELRRPSIATSLSRLSSWVLPLSTDRRNSAGRIYTEDRELGMAPLENPMARVTSPGRTKVAEIQKPQNTLDTNLASDEANMEEQSTISKDRPGTAVSIPSYYGIPSDRLPPPAGIVTRGTDSPIYGLNGIMARTRDQEKQPRPQSSTSFDELLRQQSELDRSIAALRLFSGTTPPPETQPSQPAIPVSSPPNAAVSPKARSNSASMNSYLGPKPDSASNRSDFSLSVFPEPPAVSTEDLPTSARLERLAGRTRTLRRDPTANEAAKAIASKVIEEESSSLPVSPTRYEGGTPRLESAGTQYDVTSFIGGLTVPARGSALNTGSILATAGTRLSDVESEDEPSPQIKPNSATTTQAIRPMILASSAVLASPATADVAAAATTEPPREAAPLKREPNVPLRPFLLGTSSQAIPAILPSSTMVPIGASRRKGLPSNPRRPTISGPSLPPDDGLGDQAPGAFERPRPPPLLLSK
ncbi:hypothetical protein LshimejAT787_0305720 [Lyophyllum shimeji]|uniref:Uncharacterized protein n=1 Tax=Lyophyllum shimeji TaxID=47721 RepID=A0A9P3PIX7_LYOSH|nr:hypothetical protein LshimejAT787_0305720 [Lyophyllum shimeji]